MGLLDLLQQGYQGYKKSDVPVAALLRGEYDEFMPSFGRGLAQGLEDLTTVEGAGGNPIAKVGGLIGSTKNFVRGKPEGLLDPDLVNLQDYVGASIVPMPWDATQRGQKITKISGIDVDGVGSGGPRFMDDAENVKQGVVGASNKGIANRVVDRVKDARIHNLSNKGTGQVILATNTMGDLAEGFSMTPSITSQQILGQGSKANRKLFEDELKKIATNTAGLKEKTFGKQALQNLPPLTDEDFLALIQGKIKLKSGTGAEISPGDFRKAFYKRMPTKKYEKMFGYQFDDLAGANLDDVAGLLGKGDMGNRMALINPTDTIKVVPNLDPLTQAVYDSAFTGKRLGTLDIGAQPIEKLMPDVFNRVNKGFNLQFPKKTPSELRSTSIGSIEKQGEPENYSQIITQELIDNLYGGLLD